MYRIEDTAGSDTLHELYYSDVAVEAVLTGSCESLPSDVDLEQQLVPQWLEDRLRLLSDEAAKEPLPERFVRLLRQLNQVEHIPTQR
jgi:hypothetical protein